MPAVKPHVITMRPRAASEERERGKIDAVSLVPSFRSGRIDCGYRGLDGMGLDPETVLTE